jgi:hypothetical protein
VIALDETVTGRTGRSHKPERAPRKLAEPASQQMPSALARVAELAISLSRA